MSHLPVVGVLKVTVVHLNDVQKETSPVGGMEEMDFRRFPLEHPVGSCPNEAGLTTAEVVTVNLDMSSFAATSPAPTKPEVTKLKPQPRFRHSMQKT